MRAFCHDLGVVYSSHFTPPPLLPLPRLLRPPNSLPLDGGATSTPASKTTAVRTTTTASGIIGRSAVLGNVLRYLTIYQALSLSFLTNCSIYSFRSRNLMQGPVVELCSGWRCPSEEQKIRVVLLPSHSHRSSSFSSHHPVQRLYRPRWANRESVQ